jgi:mitochondrial fission protein ELM1
MKLNKFDLVLLPQHDQKLEHNHHNNILFFNGSITHIPASKLDRAKEEWKDKINEVLLPGPKIAAIIGGNSKGCRFFVSHASDLANKLINAAHEAKGSIMVTTSRRTPELISKTILKALEGNQDKVNYFFYDSKTPGPNPYHAILASADYIIVTGDSISMACEAIESGKPTFIYEGQNMLGKKHKKFIEFLFQIKLAKRFKGYLASFKPKGFKNSELIKNEVLNKISG